jgi:hypothetical protein
MRNKKCTQCKSVKDVTEFSKCPRNKDGLDSRCKFCISEYRFKTKKRRAELVKLWKLKNPEKYKKYQEKLMKTLKENMV